MLKLFWNRSRLSIVFFPTAADRTRKLAYQHNVCIPPVHVRGVSNSSARHTAVEQADGAQENQKQTGKRFLYGEENRSHHRFERNQGGYSHKALSRHTACRLESPDEANCILKRSSRSKGNRLNISYSNSTQNLIWRNVKYSGINKRVKKIV